MQKLIIAFMLAMMLLGPGVSSPIVEARHGHQVVTQGGCFGAGGHGIGKWCNRSAGDLTG